MAPVLPVSRLPSRRRLVLPGEAARTIPGSLIAGRSRDASLLLVVCPATPRWPPDPRRIAWQGTPEAPQRFFDYCTLPVRKGSSER